MSGVIAAPERDGMPDLYPNSLDGTNLTRTNVGLRKTGSPIDSSAASSIMKANSQKNATAFEKKDCGFEYRQGVSFEVL
jgi:hypothetical protein